MAQSRASGLASDAGAQLTELKNTIADLSDRVAEIAAARGREARKQARTAAKSIRGSSGQIYSDGAEALSQAGDTALYYGRRAGHVVKQNPGLSALGVLVGVGVVAAILYASQREEERHWYDRPRSWF